MSFSAGVFSINTTGQPVVAGTVISDSVFNAFTADIATGLSTCMLKDGTQIATAGIPFFAGTVSLPGIYLGTDTQTGLYRIGSNHDGFAVAGVKVLDIASTGLTLSGKMSITGTGVWGGSTTNGLLLVTDAATLGSGLMLNATATGGSQWNVSSTATAHPLGGGFFTVVNVGAGTFPMKISATDVVTFTGTIASPTLTTPTLGVANATSINFGGSTLGTYTETTWTPALQFGGSSTGITYSNQVGTYTRIGRMVFLQASLILTSKGAQTGAATLSGLPFAAGAQQFSGTIYGTTLTHTSSLACTVTSGSQVLNLTYVTDAGVGTALDNTNFANNTTLIATISYSV